MVANSGINLDNNTIRIIDAYIEDFIRRSGAEDRIPKRSGLECLCVHELKRIMADYIGLPKVEIKVRGHELVEQKPYNNRNYEVYFHGDQQLRFDWYALTNGRTPKSKVKAHTFFDANANKICNTYIRQRYGDIETAFMAHVFFVDLKRDYLTWFDDRREGFMDKMGIEIQKKTGKIARVSSSHGGVANLLKILTRTMEQQGADIRSIAKVQYSVCTQAGIYIPDEFVRDVATVLDIEGELDD